MGHEQSSKWPHGDRGLGFFIPTDLSQNISFHDPRRGNIRARTDGLAIQIGEFDGVADFETARAGPRRRSSMDVLIR
jgi:hypothetical protein